MEVTDTPVRGRTPSLISDRSARSERLAAKDDSTFGEASSSRMRDSSGLIDRKSWRRVSRAISAMAPESSTPGGPCAHHHERQPGAAFIGIRLPLRFLECVEQLVAYGGRIFQPFQPGSERL